MHNDKATSPKRHRATNLSEISSMPLVSLGLTEVDATDTAPRRSGRPNAGTGGRNTQLEKIRVVLESRSQNRKPKGATSLSTLNPLNPQAPEPPRKGRKSRPKVQPPPYSPESTNLDVSTLVPSFSLQKGGGRFVFAASTTTPGVGPSPQASNDSYLAMGMKVTEKRNKNALIDYAHSSQRPLAATFSEHNLDPALRKEHDVSQALCAGLVGSDLEDSESSSSTTDIDDIDDAEDEEDGDEGDNNESQQFGWGEARRQHKGHPGFLAEELPTQTRIARPLMPDFDFQYSRDEDDDTSRMHLNNTNQSLGTLPRVQREQSGPQTTTSNLPDDVLKRHQDKNGQPRLPDPESLQLLNQVAELANAGSQSRSKRSKGSESGPRPDQLAWYGPRWKSFLEEVKGECRAQHALENPFPPLVKGMPGTISEVLVSVLVAWDKSGRQFEAGVWPEQQYNMTRLLYDDLSTWRSDLKKTAISIAPLSYSLLPPPSISPQQRATWVERAAKDLLKGGSFLRFGVDQNGKTRNLAHPALRDTCIAFFYTGPYQIARRQPEKFCTQLPISCLALVATVFHCVFDGLEKNGNGKCYPNFSSKEYSPIYRKMIQIIKDTLKDEYHGPRLLEQLREWAEAGWAENIKLDGGAAEAKHDDLQVVLD
ncbi:uncharacterized protein HD556DRAFT_1439350 [Suillus plorans]|uniref:DUF6532 domain-containing protein n=1 Tax=Suillus plorans TaxID=116603 RepID=A0A9P7J2U8_9AGAM|nr:uncharacterized protein HD556DRAFT_1439350 [Suillus plorans]KAG1799691.1 hypothetical protein HD556DRAFT_1439350 [Suillus plorans]